MPDFRSRTGHLRRPCRKSTVAARCLLVGPPNWQCCRSARAQAGLEIEYWQYVFDTRVKAMDELIEQVPGGQPRHHRQADAPSPMPTTRPRSPRRCRPARARTWCSSSTAGSTSSSTAGLLQPLPTDAFPPEKIEKRVLPDRDGDEARRRVLRPADRGALAGAVLQQEAVRGGRARSDKPPQTLDEFVAAAEKTAKRDGAGNITSAGIDASTWPGRTTSGGARCWSASSAASPTPTTTARSTYDSEAGAQGAAVLHRPADRAEGRPGRASWTRARPPSGRPRGHDHRRHVPPRRVQDASRASNGA